MLLIGLQRILLDPVRFESLKEPINASNHPSVSKLLTLAENADEEMFNEILERVRSTDGSKCPVVGLTGTGGAGKSSLTDELMLRIQRDNPGTKSLYSLQTQHVKGQEVHY